MTRKIWNVVLLLACLLGVSSAHAQFKDIKIDLTDGNLLESDEIANKTPVEFGVAIASDGTLSRVAADDASAAIVISGKYHSNEHGWGNFASTVKVDGPVKVSMGTCAWGQNVVVKNGAETVVTFTNNDGTCYHTNKATNIASGLYKGEAATLSISGGGYTPYIAVEAVDPSELVEDATVSFSLGESGAQASFVPAAEKVEIGKTFTIPGNFTIYLEGSTLVGWTDGSKTYEIGEIMTVDGDTELTPVFVKNTVTLDDRTAPVTICWDFRRQNGAPTVSFQNKTGFWVAQAKIGTESIDVILPFDTNNGGKIANANWTDLAQMNKGTTFQIPSCKDAVISTEAYAVITTTTIDGQVINQGTKTPTFTCASKTNPVEMVIGDGSYYRYIQVVLPVAAQAGGSTFNDEPASVIWAFNSATDYETAVAAVPENGFSTKAFNLNGHKVTGTSGRTDKTTGPLKDENGNEVVFVKIQPTTGASDVVAWTVKPAKGLTFTPTKVQGYVQRFGTDSEKGITISVRAGEGDLVNLGTWTAHRENNELNKPYDSEAIHQFVIELTPEQQQQLASTEGFTLQSTIGVGNAKQGGFSDIRIYGTLNGTVEDVEIYTLNIAASPADGGKVSSYPNASEFEAGTDVKLTAVNNFGYSFVNWTDASGKEVSDAPEFTYTMASNAELTANFKKLNTYELVLGVTGGANDYQVQPAPAGEMIDGKRMYEEGTTVTLTAISNPIVKFASWDDGQTSSEIKVTMDGDQSLTANFDAIDYIAGWDFYQAGNGRAADFYAADNDGASLVLRNAAGDIAGWLDKSEVAAGGYEGRPAAVNWRTTGLGEYYWQTKVNAEAFTDLQVITAMAYNYNAYTKQNVEYSLDGENWTKIGTITIQGNKNWTDATFDLPAAANNQKEVYVRWISDTNSPVDGTASSNDGIALGASYIIGTAKLVDDGVAPVLVSQVPEEGSNNASINGKIVLTFDEKIKVKEGVKATLGDLELTPSVTGKTVMFEYKNLTYATDYKFTLPAGSVMDLTDNAMSQAITINFTTKTRPAVAKALYDVAVTTVDELVEAINTANSRSDMTKRFRIFIHNGEYKLPASKTSQKTGTDGKSYADPTTYITGANISFIGESRDGVVITNTVPASGTGANVLEGIGKGDVLRLEKTATNTYFQHLTIKSAMGDGKGRDIEVNDNSDKTIMKDVCLWGYQDTYVSNNDKGRFYFEGGVLRGRTDFLCGKGDVYYNAVTLQMCEKGGYLAVPSVPKKYGYIFKDCEIVGESADVDGNYTLGRPWGSGTPIALYIDTKMTARPSAIGWNEMSAGWPARFAEYNSTTASGTVIDLVDRKKVFADTHANNPVLTKAEADAHSLAVVMGGDDDWDPATLAEQAPAPTNVTIEDGVISWDDSDYASHWAVCADGKVIGFTVDPTFTVESTVARAAAPVYTVRAANEMGGLGEAVEASASTGITDVVADGEVVETIYYNLQGIRVNANTPGVLIKVDTLASGETVTTKIVVK